ncbi:hypothetical protein ONE63_004891 [Megalurothrips usitatus]|uniref:Uncharacterized protein n=1 Tax=Megalurothrips usitatus TaxID=439358 RepID=A0AAV7X4Q1_9NEOP|nr:hypothetical protein ONE63_004891 [Megalurothrips usitatus]
MSDNEEGEQPRKQKRGPYKLWLHDPNRLVPESTLRSRRRNPQNLNAVDQGDNHIRPHNEPVAGNDHETEVEDALGTVNEPMQPDMQGELAVDAAAVGERPAPPPNIVDGADNDPGYDADSQRTDYIKKYNLNSLLHHSSSVTRLETLLMILFLAVRHCHTQSFIEAQIAFVNMLFGEEVLDISYHIFQSVFPASKSIVKHYFCPDCENYLGSDKYLVGVKEKLCDDCKKIVKVNNIDCGNFFVTLSIEEQLRALLEQPDTILVDHASRSSEGLSDIFDGNVFKRCKELGIPIEDVLTLTINTDGVRVFKSTQNSMYPILSHLNELIPEQRFKVDNVILCGLWFGRSAPTMSLFLKPFITEVLNLSTNGLSYRQANGTMRRSYVFPLACSLDSVAKPKVTCQKQFNGYDGCPYCLHPNDAVSPGDNQRHYDTSKTFPLRTEESVISDMYSAHSLKKSGSLKKDEAVNGFMGLSILLMFSDLLLSYPKNTFHIVWSVVIDYMHSCLEGIMADLLSLYLNLLDADQIGVLNQRILSIKPPQAMTRRPRPISDKVKWKAKEYRAFLLYYSLPCLEGLLPSSHFALLKLFVNSMHILLSDNITPRALSEAKNTLETFVSGFQRLYGLSNVTYNLHLLTHLCDQVYQLGPLWCYSNFVFESCNGRLVKLVKGTRSLVSEISKKFSRLQIVPRIIHQNPINDKVLEFGNTVLGYKYGKEGRKINGAFLPRGHSVVEITAHERYLFEASSIPIQNNSVQFYHRVISQGLVFCSHSYSKNHIFNDSCIMLADGTYALLDKILLSLENELMCLIIPIRTVGFIIPSIKTCAQDCYDLPSIVPFSFVSKKCVLIALQTRTFICDLPNSFERD